MRAIVRVGVKSVIRLRGVETKRAISTKALVKSLAKESFEFVVIECATLEDIEAVEMTGIKLSTVYASINKSDAKLVDKCMELGMNIYSNVSEIEDTIESKCGIKGFTVKSSEDVIREASKLSKELKLGENDDTQEDSNLIETSKSDSIDYSKVNGNKDSSKDDSGFKVIDSVDMDAISQELETARSTMKELSLIIESQEVKLDNYRKTIDKLFNEGEAVEVSWGGDTKELEAEIAGLKAELKKYDNAEATIELLRNSLEAEKLKENDYLSQIGTVSDCKEAEVEARLALSKVIKELCFLVTRLKKDIADRKIEVGSLMKSVDEQAEINRQLVDKIQRMDEEHDGSEQILRDNVEELESKLEGANDEITKLSEEIDKSSEEMQRRQNVIDELQSKLEEAESKVGGYIEKASQQTDELAKYRSMGIEDLIEDNKALRESNSTLLGEVGRRKRNEEQLERKCDEKDKQIRQLREYNSQLETTAKSISRSVDATENINMSCNYTGKAFILPVFASGSYGATSIAQAIANTLEGRVLIVDFDITSPTLDGYYNTSPILRDLPDIQNELKRTGLGCLVEMGMRYLLEHEKIIVKPVRGKGTCGGTVDYISGSYQKIDIYKLLAVDFTDFFTYFGNEYDYIVCDCGRLGSSEVENSIIRMIDGISFRNVYVTLANEVDCRSAALKLRAFEISQGKTIWVANMMKRMSMTDIMKKAINYAADYITIPFKPTVYAEVEELDKNRDLSSYIRKLVNIVFE